MKLYRLVYVSKTAKTVWYYTGQGMTATDGGWSQYEDDALVVEKNAKTLLQVMRLGGPRVTGNSLDDHYFIEERDSDSAWDWTRHTQSAGAEYKDYQPVQESGQLDLFALQPDQVGDGWVNDRSVSAVKPTSTVDDVAEPDSSISVSAEDGVDQAIKPSRLVESDDLLKPLDFTDAILTTASKPEPEAKPTRNDLPDLPDLPDAPTSVSDCEQSVDAELNFLGSAMVSDDLVEDVLTDDDDVAGTESDVGSESLPADLSDTQVKRQVAAYINDWSLDLPVSDESEYDAISATDADLRDFDGLLPYEPTTVTKKAEAEVKTTQDSPTSVTDREMDEAAVIDPNDQTGDDAVNRSNDEVVPANEVQAPVVLDEVTGATFDAVDQMLIDQEWLGYLIRQGAMLDLWTPAAVEQLLATLQTDDEADTTEDLKAWWEARPEAKPDNLTAWLQWGDSLITSLEGQDELSVYHHDLGAIAQLVGRALGVAKHSRWSDRVWTPLDRWLDRNHEHNLARLQELRVQWRELIMTLPISQAAKDRLLGPEVLNPLTIDDVKWQSVGDALAFLRQPVAATVWLSWRSIMEDMDVEDWRQADARYIYPAVMQWLQTVEPAVLDLQPHDPAWEVGVNYVATFGFELVDRVARFLQAQNQTDQVLNLIKYWTKPERIGVNETDFRALWLNDLSQETSELRTSRGLNLWLEEQSPVPVLGRTVANLRPVVTVLHRYGQTVGHWPKAWWQAWSQEWLQAGLIDQEMANEVAQWGETDRFALTADLPWAQVSDDLDKHFYTSGQYEDFAIRTDVAKDTPMSRVDMDLYDPRLVYQAIQYLQAALRQRKPAETMLNQLDGKIAQDMFHSLEMLNLSQLSDEQNREFLNLLQTTRRTRRQVKDLVLLLKALEAVFDGDKLPKILHQLDNTASANHYHFRSRDFADALKQIARSGKEG